MAELTGGDRFADICERVSKAQHESLAQAQHDAAFLMGALQLLLSIGVAADAGEAARLAGRQARAHARQVAGLRGLVIELWNEAVLNRGVDFHARHCDCEPDDRSCECALPAWVREVLGDQG